MTRVPPLGSTSETVAVPESAVTAYWLSGVTATPRGAAPVARAMGLTVTAPVPSRASFPWGVRTTSSPLSGSVAQAKDRSGAMATSHGRCPDPRATGWPAVRESRSSTATLSEAESAA